MRYNFTRPLVTEWMIRADNYFTRCILLYCRTLSCTHCFFSIWGGELFDRIVLEEHISEEDVVNYVKQLCEALLFLHQRRIVHLDVKPENILCLSPNSCHVKLIDFGLATALGGPILRKMYGTRDYMAPEVLNYNGLDLVNDMWSVGVVTYTL